MESIQGRSQCKRLLVLFGLITILFSVNIGAMIGYNKASMKRKAAAQRTAAKKAREAAKTKVAIKTETVEQVIAKEVNKLGKGQFFVYQEGTTDGIIVNWDVLQLSNSLKNMIQGNGDVSTPRAIPMPFSIEVIKVVFDNAIFCPDENEIKGGVASEDLVESRKALRVRNSMLPLSMLIDAIKLCDASIIDLCCEKELLVVVMKKIVETISGFKNMLTDYNYYWNKCKTGQEIFEDYSEYQALKSLDPDLANKIKQQLTQSDFFINVMINILKWDRENNRKSPYYDRSETQIVTRQDVEEFVRKSEGGLVVLLNSIRDLIVEIVEQRKCPVNFDYSIDDVKKVFDIMKIYLSQGLSVKNTELLNKLREYCELSMEQFVKQAYLIRLMRVHALEVVYIKTIIDAMCKVLSKSFFIDSNVRIDLRRLIERQLEATPFTNKSMTSLLASIKRQIKAAWDSGSGWWD